MAEKYIALPKGVSENTFDAAIAAFRNVLGDPAVRVRDRAFQRRLGRQSHSRRPMGHHPARATPLSFRRAGARWSGIRRRISWQCSSVVIFYERHRNFPCFSHRYPKLRVP